MKEMVFQHAGGLLAVWLVVVGAVAGRGGVPGMSGWEIAGGSLMLATILVAAERFGSWVVFVVRGREP